MLSSVALAQEQGKPEAPKPKTNHKVFIAGISLLAASKTGLVELAEMCMKRLPTYFPELQPLADERKKREG